EIGPEERIPPGNERVLFVDDEKELVDLGRQMLESIGYNVGRALQSIKSFLVCEGIPQSRKRWTTCFR
ncbi:MAG: hypothetical protein SV375_21600, partial [Thermodesulfobacteriota bacterium]|nr:hypothetical protein [Thermodesulfobacteriota bacterium]